MQNLTHTSLAHETRRGCRCAPKPLLLGAVDEPRRPLLVIFALVVVLVEHFHRLEVVLWRMEIAAKELDLVLDVQLGVGVVGIVDTWIVNTWIVDTWIVDAGDVQILDAGSAGMGVVFTVAYVEDLIVLRQERCIGIVRVGVGTLESRHTIGGVVTQRTGLGSARQEVVVGRRKWETRKAQLPVFKQVAAVPPVTAATAFAIMNGYTVGEQREWERFLDVAAQRVQEVMNERR